MPRTIRLKGYRKGYGRKLRRRKPRTKLADKKINTLVERRMLQIAKKEATKARAKSYIDYELGAYQNDGSTYNTSGGWATLTKNGDGTILNVFAIPKADEDDDASTVSRRTSDFVYIRGFKTSGILRLQGDSADMADFRVKVCLFSFRRAVDALQSDILTELPTPCVYNDLNGSPPDEAQKEDYSKVTMLASKVITCRPRRSVELFKPFSLSHYFKAPQKNQYVPSDTNGVNPQLRTYFFAAFIDRELPPKSDGTAVQQPQIVCNTRCYYFQE